MKELTEIYEDIESENCTVLWGNLNLPCDALVICADQNYAIFADHNKIKKASSERNAMSHELAHIQTATLYGLDSDPITVDRCETRAIRCQYKYLIPFAELSAAVRSGLDCTELSELFGVDEPFMHGAIQYYTGVCGLKLSCPEW